MIILRRSIVPLVILASALVIACGGGDDGGSDVDVADYPYPVEQPEVLEDRTHFALGTIYTDYTSDPPTSGPHALAPADWGVSDVLIAKEQAVHNMEHAGVVVWYNCTAGTPLDSDACTVLRNALAQIVSEEAGSGRRVVMTPYPTMDTQIGLTSWGYVDKFDEFDGERVRLFIETFECNYDPEHFC
jgi:hypothetical protein